MVYPNMHKAPRQSQIRKNDMGALEQNNATRKCLVGHPHTARHSAPDRMMPQGRKRKTGHPNVQKALGRSKLIKTEMGALTRCDTMLSTE